MSLVRRSLFWKIYLTLLCSLTLVAFVMGGLWWLLGETPHERWSAFRAHLTEQIMAVPDKSGDALEKAVERLGDEIGSDLSLYGSDGAIVAAHGTPITYPSKVGDALHRPHFFVRTDLPDGRTVLVRALPPPPAERVRGILTAIIIVVAGVALAAFPMTAKLTRRLETLRRGMARWGDGDLWARVAEEGSDEVASVAHTFNVAAERINALLVSHKALLANASHELRSPLARLRLAIDLWRQHPESSSHAEIVRNLAEIDGLVEEILLSSRLDHPSSSLGRTERVDLLGLAAEEATRTGATVEGTPLEVEGSETLLRRVLRNLLENAVSHGAPPVNVEIRRDGGEAMVIVADGGKGIPEGERERVFEPFYRPAGRSEASGGWGLGLALVRQIATRHGGSVTCEGAGERGNSFVVRLPLPADWAAPSPPPSPKGDAEVRHPEPVATVL